MRMAETPQAEKPVTRTRKILNIVSGLVFALVCISLVVGSILFVSSNDPDKSYFGYRIYNVVTTSMTPKSDGSSPSGGFAKGAVIIVKLSNPEDIEVGDIITFNPTSGEENSMVYLTHRVVEIKDELDGNPGIYFVTQGDANDSTDPPISGSMMIGKKVFHIPYVGSALQWVRENFILVMIILASFFMSIIMLRWYFAKPKESN